MNRLARLLFPRLRPAMPAYLPKGAVQWRWSYRYDCWMPTARPVHLPMLLLFLCALMCSCAMTEELMIGEGQPFAFEVGQKIPNNPALVAALAGNKVYRTRNWLFGGDHNITTSSGSEYQHALAQSLKDVLQAAGVLYTAWTSLQWQLAQVSYDKFLAGEITKREFQQQVHEIDTLHATVPNPNDGVVEAPPLP